MLLTEVCRALEDRQVRFAIVGGYAVALHGAVRGTIDVDLVLAKSEANYVKAEAALRSIGLESRLPLVAKDVFQYRAEYIEQRNLIAWSFIDHRDPTRLVDIILTSARSRLPVTAVVVGGVSVPVLNKAALIAMKESSGRPQDVEDVRALRSLK